MNTHAPWSVHKQLLPFLSQPPCAAELISPNKHRFRCVALGKQAERFISSLVTATTSADSSAADRLINKFVASTPKSTALDALSHLLSSHPTCPPRLSSLALPLYEKISEASWFEWNPKLVANVAAALEKQGCHTESEKLVAESVSRLQSKERDLAVFYCNLVELHGKNNSGHGFDRCYSCLNQLVCDSNSVYVKKQGYKSMISGLCEMGRPEEAEVLVEEMRGKGIKPSLFEYRCVLHGYGTLGLFGDMIRIVDRMESEGLEVDTVCSNMILASYGARNTLPDMVSWLRKMKDLGIPLSLRTCNSVLNSCPAIMSLMQGSNNNAYPVSMGELMKVLDGDEAMLVKELVGSSVLSEAMKWEASEGKLDLHGMHLGTAYLMLLQWMEEMSKKLFNGKDAIPAEITVVCGSGKHSNVRGESPVKSMVKDIMFRTKSPMRIDRKNVGCFVGKGKVVKQWLS